MYGYRHGLLLGTLLLAPLLAGAQDTNAPVALEGEADPGRSLGEKVDDLHDDLSEQILNVTHRFDSFFGEELIDDDQDDTLVRLQMTAEMGENNRQSFNNRLSVRLKLPRLHDRVQLIFDDIVEKNDEKNIVQEVKDSEPLTGVRYAVRENQLHYNLDVGAKLRMEPDAFVRARASKVFPMDPWMLKLSQDVYWLMRDGPGEITQARFSRRLNHLYLFRAITRGSWDESHDGITLSQSFSLYQEVSKRKALRYTIAGEMPTSTAMVMDEYKALVTWRQLVRGDWLYIEIEPAASFPRNRDYEFTPTILFKLDLMFGDSPDGFWQ